MLVRRTRRALAGWADPLTGRTENPVQKPWAPWGDPRTVVLDGTGMVLGNDGGWFQPNPNGGIAYEHMPLTPNWEMRFSRTLSEYESDGILRVYLDRNWTAGGSANSTRYQTYLQLEQRTKKEKEDDGSTRTRVYRDLLLVQRDTSSWIGGAEAAVPRISDSEWSKKLTIAVRVFRDKVVILYLNGQRWDFRDITDTRYNFTGGQRAGNFAQISGPVNRVTDFATRDIPGLRDTWVLSFSDTFDRPNSTSVGNGWSQAGAQFGIWNNSLSMRDDFFPGDGHRGAWRTTPTATRDQRVEAILGGGNGSPGIVAWTYIVMRANAAFSSGLAFRIRDGSFELVKFSGSATSPSFGSVIVSQNAIIDNGMEFAFNIVGDQAWVDRIDGGRLDCVLWTDGIDAEVGNQRYIGVIVQRLAFANSVPIANLRAYDAA